MKRNLDIDRARRELALVRQSNGDYIPSAAIRDWTTNLPALLDELESARAVVEAAERYSEHTPRADSLPAIAEHEARFAGLRQALSTYRQTIGKGGAR